MSFSSGTLTVQPRGRIRYREANAAGTEAPARAFYEWRTVPHSALKRPGQLPLRLGLPRRGRRLALGRPVLQLHSQGEPHLREDLLDLLQRLAAEVLRLQHLGLGLLDEIADGLDVGVLEAVRGADGELELVHRAEQVLVELRLLDGDRLRG